MILKSLAIILCLSLTITFSYGNPLLVAEPIENLVDYYVIAIDGKEMTLQPAFDTIFLYDLKTMKDGRHTIILKPGNFEMDDGVGVMFYLTKKTEFDLITYTIEKDPIQLKSDPDYEGRFMSPQTVTIANNADNNPPVDDPDDDGDSGGGDGSGCSA